MNSMKLSKKYEVSVMGKCVHDLTLKEEWKSFIVLDGGPNRGELIVRRKDGTNGAAWAKQNNAFIEQELVILCADDRFCLPETEVVFGKPKAK